MTWSHFSAEMHGHTFLQSALCVLQNSKACLHICQASLLLCDVSAHITRLQQDHLANKGESNWCVQQKLPDESEQHSFGVESDGEYVLLPYSLGAPSRLHHLFGGKTYVTG